MTLLRRRKFTREELSYFRATKKDDYFFLTNLSISGSTPGTYKGAFHLPGRAGGMQVMPRNTTYSETVEELTTHEFGHRFGLPHTWESNNFIQVIIAGSGLPSAGGLTRDNFMDYNVRRKKWLKIQLLNYIRRNE